MRKPIRPNLRPFARSSDWSILVRTADRMRCTGRTEYRLRIPLRRTWAHGERVHALMIP
jgi:hypothetical protein